MKPFSPRRHKHEERDHTEPFELYLGERSQFAINLRNFYPLPDSILRIPNRALRFAVIRFASTMEVNGKSVFAAHSDSQ